MPLLITLIGPLSCLLNFLLCIAAGGLPGLYLLLCGFRIIGIWHLVAFVLLIIILKRRKKNGVNIEKSIYVGLVYYSLVILSVLVFFRSVGIYFQC